MTPEQIGIVIAFTAGLLSFLSPCVLPLMYKASSEGRLLVELPLHEKASRVK